MLPEAWSGDPDEMPICAGLCLAEQVSGSGCFWDPISELAADKEAFVWPASLPHLVAGDSGPRPLEQGVGVWVVVRGWLRTTTDPGPLVSSRKPFSQWHLLMVSLLYTGITYLAVAFSRKGALRNLSPASSFRKWGD